MKSTILSYLAAVVASLQVSDGLEFVQYQAQYGKSYKTQEEHSEKFANFRDNLQKVQEHNAKGLGFTFGLNKFSDLHIDDMVTA